MTDGFGIFSLFETQN